jgi:phosphatidylserine/phosphatidylglycerophosphate/cardiolipin synthase-like enzyme
MTNPFTPVSLLGDGGKKVIRGQAACHAGAHRQDHLEPNAFAPLRHGNEVECFTTGQEYFTRLAAVMGDAKKSIFIAGWQINWDVELVPGKRLIDILHERVHSSETLRVYVMPWMSPKVGVDTGDLGTMLAVFQLNAGRKTMQAMCCPAGAQSDYLGSEGAAFSHHQKMIVVDNRIAFVGGIDVAYGRADDAKFSLDPGKRRFKERYNPGVPAIRAITPADGPSLSDLDLLSTTFTYGLWDKGGNTEPGAMSKFLAEAQVKADKFAIEAVSLVNRAARLMLDAEVAAVKTQVKGIKSIAKAGADVAVAAANAVSRQCAALTVPDLYNGVQSLKVGTASTSELPKALRDTEKTIRSNWNAGIDGAARVAHFFAPLKSLRVDPKPQSSLPGAIESAERTARAGANATIDVTAALAGEVQEGAESARTVCVAIGPATERTVAETKAALREAEREIKATATAAANYTAGQVNLFQRGVIEQLNAVREALNTRLLAMMEIVKRGSGQAISKLSQHNVEAVVEELRNLMKMVYAQQLAVSWLHASAHPLLMDKRTKSATDAVLGPSQPRQPWQDVHCQIEGPAVDDLALNFIRRWNASTTSYLTDPDVTTTFSSPFETGFAWGLADSALDKVNDAMPTAQVMKQLLKIALIGPELLPPPRPPQPAGAPPTGVAVRVLRSAPRKMCLQELQAQGSKVLPAREQHEIESAMIQLISNATDFIYIENQFFQTDFGEPSIDAFSDAGRELTSGPVKFLMGQMGNDLTARLSSAGNAPGKKLYPANGIGKALGDRITQAVRRGQPFHVYMVLPVHPEGALTDITIVGQIHWTMQSLVFAENSLVNRVRRAIKAKSICKRPLNNDEWNKALDEAGKTENKVVAYESILEEEWAQYLTLLNLRNCETVAGKVRTEQIYIHSKLLIVDDRHVIMGSANINDRSLSGKRDSEIAVMLFDCEQEMKTICDTVTSVNPLARRLRVDLWKKHFALTGGGNEIVQPAKEMMALIEKPAAQATVNAVRRICLANAKSYRSSFPFTPWSAPQTANDELIGASLWPVCPKGSSAETAAKLSVKMPFDEKFWTTDEMQFKRPEDLKGYFTMLPVYWTIGENNHPGEMNVMLLSQVTPALVEVHNA